MPQPGGGSEDEGGTSGPASHFRCRMPPRVDRLRRATVRVPRDVRPGRDTIVRMAADSDAQFAQAAMHVGEAGRSLKIAATYGELLGAKGRNLRPKTLELLTKEYPSHGFVIDRFQAERLFLRVRHPHPTEAELANLLGDAALTPIDHPQEPILAFLNDEATAREPSLPGLENSSTGKGHDNEKTTPFVADDSPSGRSGDSGSDTAGAEQVPSTGLREVGAGVR